MAAPTTVPSGLSANPGETQILWSWGQVAGALGYEIDSTGPAPVDPVDPPPVGTVTQLGLHVTNQELAVWRDRAVNGPFKSQGDYATNSPGDWDRIAGYKNTFMSSFTPYTTSHLTTSGSRVVGSTANQSSNSHRVHGKYLLSAAFYALVKQDAQVASAVAAGLYAHTNISDLNFANRSRWVINEIRDINPGFQICIYIAQAVTAYDYLLALETETGASYLSSSQRAAINLWLYDAADYWQNEMTEYLDKQYSGRYSDPPNYGSISEGSPYEAFHDGSTRYYNYSQQRSFNNRRAAMHRATYLIGRVLDRIGYTPPSGASPGVTLPRLIRQGQLWVEENCRFALTNNPFTWGDADRKQAMFNYGMAALGTVITVCDVETRLGNNYYDYATTAGANVSLGGTKSVRLWVEKFQQYVRGELNHWWSDSLSTSGPRVGPLAMGDHRVRDVGMAQAGLYYGDQLMLDTFVRQASGAPSFPSSPADAETGFMGTEHDLPGALFMFYDTGVNPYGG